ELGIDDVVAALRLPHREVLLLADRDFLIRGDERELPVAGDRIDHAAGGGGQRGGGGDCVRRAADASNRRVSHTLRSSRAARRGAPGAESFAENDNRSRVFGPAA